MGGRLYNDKQVREILKRASETQSSGSEGISLEELKQVGTELGFDPGQIELAAQQLGSPPFARKGPLSGRLFLDQTVEGEISSDTWQGMVAVVQRYYKKSGTVNHRGSNYDWMASDDASSMALTVSSSKGKTRIRLESNSWAGPFFTSLFCPIFTLVACLSSLKHDHVATAVGAVVFGLSMMVVLFWHFRLSHQQTASALMDRLITETQLGEDSDPTPVIAHSSSNPIDADLENQIKISTRD